jgi:hypothetical protein
MEFMNDAYLASESPGGRSRVSKKAWIHASLASLRAAFPDLGIVGLMEVSVAGAMKEK